ncbi:MAG: MBL fold metallo-hydrolase [Proteobacteria bacterium]|nr:MBL fold metallo-hydrolase [Pseudomonadota bacterium]
MGEEAGNVPFYLMPLSMDLIRDFEQLLDDAQAQHVKPDVMVLDTQATPIMARKVIEKIRTVTDKPIKYIAISHYHAVRVLGASAYGAEQIIASQDTYDLIVERGDEDFKSELERFPRLFNGVESIPGLTWPTITFKGEMTVWMGKREVRLMQLGRGHSKGDTVIWLPQEKVLFSGDLVEYGATPYTGDAYLNDWPQTLDRLAALEPVALVPGRGDALTTPQSCLEAIEGTKSFLHDMFESVKQGRKAGKSLKEVYAQTYHRLKPDYGHWVIFDHCLPFDVSRAFDEAGGTVDPRIWTAQRDAELWQSLETGPVE